MTDHEKLNLLKKRFNLKNKDIAKIIGNTEYSVKSVTSKSKKLPRWIKLALYVFENMDNKLDN